jgi:carboxypeptidase PM20D1
VRRILLVAGAVAAAIVAVVLVTAARLPSRQPAVDPVAKAPVDGPVVAERLARGLRFPTISHQDPAALDARAFFGLHRLLAETYPKLHSELRRETVSEYSLLYEWKGRNADLAPALLLAHLDVVPVETGTEDDWIHPPFSGVIADGYVWGRGAMDDKQSVFCILEAVEALLSEDFRPERTLYIGFGHDEEVGGERGAVAIAALLASRDVRLAFVLDEAGVVARGVLPGFDLPLAVLGIAEKGSVDIELSVEVAGGHSSTPPRSTAIGILSAAIHALETHPMPASIGGATGLFLDYLGPELPFPLRAVLANRWLFGPIIQMGFGYRPELDAMIRTSTAATIVRGGVKSNVLPARASAVVNFRILPGETYDDVVQYVQRTIADERVALRVGVRSEPRDPSPVSPVDSQAFETLQRTILQLFPDAIVVPYLVVGGTDSRYFYDLTDNVYRFGPFIYGKEDLARAHGTNERIALTNLENGVRFYRQLILNSRSAGP